MITERRQITFSDEALKDAVLLFRSSHPDRMPHGALRRVRAAAEPDAHAVAEFEQGAAASPQEHTLSAREIAAAIILYCRRAKIPLPRQGEKRLHVENGRMSLVITSRRNPEPVSHA